MKRPLPNTYWVVEGRLLAGEFPGGETESQTRKRLAKLLAAGIDSFIDLTEAHERTPYRDLLPREVNYYHRPMPDHGVPADIATMHEVQAVLRSALAGGRRVYVHCRAGIGRTGMTIACHLAESEGKGNEVALERLNALWQQNARARSWPRVPETEEQEQFVLRYRPAAAAAATPAAGSGMATVAPAMALPAAAAAPPGAAPPAQAMATATTSSRLRALPPMGPAERARGAMLGLAIGDALAVSLQDAPAGTPVPAGYEGGGAADLPPGAWTDDTAMALCLADSLLACEGTDTRDQAERYLRWLRDGERSATGVAVGVRPELRRTLALAATRHTALSGTHDPRVLDAEPLCRCAPPAIFHLGDVAAAVEAAADAARVSHQAPVLVDACRLFAAMLHAALSGAPRPAILACHREWSRELRSEVLDVATGWTAPGGRRHRGAILVTLDAVVRAFATATDFRAGLATLLAQPPAQRGEADVAGAAYGQLAGAFFGERGLPRNLRNGLAGADDIAALGEALLPPAPEAAEPLNKAPHSR